MGFWKLIGRLLGRKDPKDYVRVNSDRADFGKRARAFDPFVTRPARVETEECGPDEVTEPVTATQEAEEASVAKLPEPVRRKAARCINGTCSITSLRCVMLDETGFSACKMCNVADHN